MCTTLKFNRLAENTVPLIQTSYRSLEPYLTFFRDEGGEVLGEAAQKSCAPSLEVFKVGSERV